MKLENVDVSQLKISDIPKFNKCPCELCDDGCFDRAGNKHHPECRRQAPQPTKLSLAARCPLSHYKGSFLAATTLSDGQSIHRRQACTPAPDNHIPISFKNASISKITSQRDDYKPPSIDPTKSKSASIVKREDNIILSRSVPMETQSNYQIEYVEKPVFPTTLRTVKDSGINISESTGTMASQTTTRSHFKEWQQAPSHSFAEKPSAAGYVLFPGSNRQFSTTSGTTFVPYKNATQAKPFVRLEHSGNMRISGSMDFKTNYRQDYLIPELPSTLNERKPISNEQKVYTRRPMNDISQTSYDFRSYSNQQPARLAETEAFLSQISIGNSFTPIEKHSQYRADYMGHDTNKHPREPPAAPKDHKKPYAAPIQKMDTLTITQRDFQPIDLASLPRINLVPLKSNFSVNDQQSKMENMTMSRFHYQPYPAVGSRRNYGEILSTVYIPPMDKFQGTTTTGETYQGRIGAPARPCVPEAQTIHRVGEQDHNTNYRVDYHPHGLSLCAAKAYTIAQKKETTPISS